LYDLFEKLDLIQKEEIFLVKIFNFIRHLKNLQKVYKTYISMYGMLQNRYSLKLMIVKRFGNKNYE